MSIWDKRWKLGKPIQILNCKNEKKNNLITNVQNFIFGNDLENYCELYIDGKKMNICWKYKFVKKGETKIKNNFKAMIK